MTTVENALAATAPTRTGRLFSFLVQTHAVANSPVSRMFSTQSFRSDIHVERVFRLDGPILTTIKFSADPARSDLSDGGLPGKPSGARHCIPPARARRPRFLPEDWPAGLADPSGVVLIGISRHGPAEQRRRDESCGSRRCGKSPPGTRRAFRVDPRTLCASNGSAVTGAAIVTDTTKSPTAADRAAWFERNREGLLARSSSCRRVGQGIEDSACAVRAVLGDVTLPAPLRRDYLASWKRHLI
jgi:hypothetical protein